VSSIHIGTSGWSYPSWRPGFYPAGLAPNEFLRFYAEAFDTVELNTTGYRLPSADQFKRWAEAVPDGFRFAPKVTLRRPGGLETFLARALGLADRLGPVRVVVEAPRDERLLEQALAVFPAGVEVAFDFRDASWAPLAAAVVAVGAVNATPFRYLRLRDPPYSDDELSAVAERLQAPGYVYFRHEQAPTAPHYARRLRELLTAAPSAPG
jgi:uncharacterized protein YecE (DUF72 family)